MTNPIVVENQRPGSPSTEWDINGWGDPTIQGFGHDISINRGETISFRIKTDSDNYRIDIYRLGYYGGLGARLIDTVHPSVPLPQEQPEGIKDPGTLLHDCGNWAVSASWQAPSDATSGIYIARLIRQDDAPFGWRVDNSRSEPAEKPEAVPHAYGVGGRGRLANALREPRASHIYFVVRDDERVADILFQTADTTWQAYNRYGGHSTYARLDPAYPRVHGGPPRASLPGSQHGIQRRVSVRAFSRGQRVRRHLRHRTRQRPAGRAHPQSPSVLVGGSRRVLVARSAT